MVLDTLRKRLPVDEQALHIGLTELRLAGRFQVVPGAVEHLLDVAHNPQAAGVLADALRQHPAREETHAIIGMLKDKDCRGVFAALRGSIDAWYLVDLPGSRGASGRHLIRELRSLGVDAPAAAYRAVGPAMDAARSRTRPGDRILITGSFLTVASALEYLGACSGAAA
jgi:dihydrofolate synthase/folylpolyglutamate synthase